MTARAPKVSSMEGSIADQANFKMNLLKTLFSMTFIFHLPTKKSFVGMNQPCMMREKQIGQWRKAASKTKS